MKPKVCVLRSAGTNCDQETAAAFLLAGAEVESLHINSLVSGRRKLDNFHILVLSGGFSYGDDVSSGKIFANELKFKLNEELKKFINDGKLVIGICNGFQILVKSGFLADSAELKQDISLILNDSAKFEARWVYLKPAGKSVWTKGIKEIIYLPVAHGEGKFITADKELLNKLKKNKQIIFQYCNSKGRTPDYPDNPNGSVENIAGLSDPTGRILGMMPHPERHVFSAQHPRNWELKGKKYGAGLQIFKNGVDYIKKNFTGEKI